MNPTQSIVPESAHCRKVSNVHDEYSVVCELLRNVVRDSLWSNLRRESVNVTKSMRRKSSESLPQQPPLSLS